MEKIEVLIVEDKQENKEAAQKYFKTRNDVKIDFASTFEEGLKKLRQKKHDFGIFDLELPKKEGDEPEKLGFDLAKEAEKLIIPWAVITAGIDHHQCYSAFVSYFWEEEKAPREITETPKNDPRAWQKVFEKLEAPLGKDNPIYRVLKRAGKNVYTEIHPTRVLLTPIGNFARKLIS